MRSDGDSLTKPQKSMRLLSKSIRIRRRQLRLNQTELAALAGVGPVFIYDLEHGKPTVRFDKLLAVLDVLGLELHLREGKALVTIAETLSEQP